MEPLHWREVLRRDAPLLIYYPACGGGEECITACPFSNEVWKLETIKVTLFGVSEKPRRRPVMVNPEACRRCYVCVQACPTGALRVNDGRVFHGRCREALVLIYNVFKLPFKRKYGVRFVFKRAHIRRFLRNNFGVTS